MNYETTKNRQAPNSTFNHSNLEMRPMHSEQQSGNTDLAQEDLSQEELEALVFEKVGSSEKLKDKSTRRNAWGYCSYAQLIAYAILSSPEKRLTLNDIYEWLIHNIAYFRERSDKECSKNWKNSIRHNLSLHGRFKRIINEVPGKSSWWIVCNEERTKKHKNSKKIKKDAKDVDDICNTLVNHNTCKVEMSNCQEQLYNNDPYQNYMMICQQRRQDILEQQQVLNQQLIMLEREEVQRMQTFNSLGQAQMSFMNGSMTNTDFMYNPTLQGNVGMNGPTPVVSPGYCNNQRSNFTYVYPTRDMTIVDVQRMNNQLGVNNLYEQSNHTHKNEEPNSTRRSQTTITPSQWPLPPPPAIPNPFYRPISTVPNINVGIVQANDATSDVWAEVTAEQSEVLKPTPQHNEDGTETCKPS